MHIKSKSVVLGLEQQNYTNRQGQPINQTFLYYFHPLDHFDTRLERGYRVLRIDVYPDFSMSDFSSEFPAIYEFKQSAVRGRQGKAEPKLTEIKFEKSITIDTSRGSLILGAKFVEVEGEDSSYKGLKLFILGDYVNEDDSVGVLPIEMNLQNAKFSSFPKLPGIYDLNLQSARGRGGTAIYKLIDVKFLSAWGDISNQPNQQAG
jgi:hypothetical protein